MAEQRPYIGGQAVIEGVMMRAPHGISVAVRRPNGAIAVQEGPHTSKLGKTAAKIPGLRGVATMVEALTIGYRALAFSAEQQMTEDELAEAHAQQAEAGNSSRAPMMVATIIALLLFIALPQALAALVNHAGGFGLVVQDGRFQLLIGAFKMTIFAAYLLAISRLPDVRRLFQYHGAEHKTIFAYEADLPLTVENVKTQSTLHPRCGTTFLVVVVIVSVLLGAVVTPLIVPRSLTGLPAQLVGLAVRIALLPFIAAVSFELQRFAARYCTKGPLRVLLYPGFMFQKITTREPDEKQIEIAIAAMRAAIWRERVGGESPSGPAPLVFESFDAFAAAVDTLRPALAEAA